MAVHHLAVASHLECSLRWHQVHLDDFAWLALWFVVESNAAGQHDVADLVNDADARAKGADVVPVVALASYLLSQFLLCQVERTASEIVEAPSDDLPAPVVQRVAKLADEDDLPVDYMPIIEEAVAAVTGTTQTAPVDWT